jgi:hypothetical protein
MIKVMKNYRSKSTIHIRINNKLLIKKKQKNKSTKYTGCVRIGPTKFQGRFYEKK